MGRPLKTAKTATVDTGFSNPSGYGVVGGDIGFTNDQILCRVRVPGESEADGFIIRQKGSRKYLVEDIGGDQGTCVLVDKADGSLDEGEMTVTITKFDTTTTRLAKFSGHYGYDFDGVGYYLSFGAADDVPVGGIFEVAQVASD